MAMAQVAQWAMQEATLLAALDYFVAIATLASACLVLVAAERALRHRRQRPGPGHLPSVPLQERA